MSASDVTGIVAAGVAIAVVELAPWQTAFVLVVLPVGVVLVAFARTSREPLVVSWTRLGLRETTGRLVGRRRFRLGSSWPTSPSAIVIAYSLRSFATSGGTNFLPVFLIATQGFSFEFASGAHALRFVVGIVAKPFSGFLGDRALRPGIAIVSLLLTGGIGLLVVAPSGAVAIGGIALYRSDRNRSARRCRRT